MIIIKHEWKMNLKSLLIWTAAIGSMVLSFMLMFPMFEDSLVKMNDAYQNMGDFSNVFGLDKLTISTAIGFYGTEVATMLSLGGALFGALLGASMLSKEEGGHTAEFLFTSPISRCNVILQKLAAIILILAVFELTCFLLALLSFSIIGEPVDVAKLILFHLAQTMMHLEISCICFGVSAFCRKPNVGLGIGIALILYFLDIMLETVEDLEFLKYITPYYYSAPADILSSGKIDGVLLFIGIGIMFVFILGGFFKYSKKDIAA